MAAPLSVAPAGTPAAASAPANAAPPDTARTEADSGGRDFASVLRDTPAPGDSGPKEPAQVEQGAESKPAPKTEATTDLDPGGNSLPPWIAALAVALPATATPQAPIDPAQSQPPSGESTTAAMTNPAPPIVPARPVPPTAPSTSGPGVPDAAAMTTGTDDNPLLAAMVGRPPTPAEGDSAGGHEQRDFTATLAAAQIADQSAPAAAARSDQPYAAVQHAVAQRVEIPVTPAVPAAISTPVHHPQWQDAFAARVAWQVGEGIQRAELNLNPPELGPVEVRLSVNDDQVSAQFFAHHGLVRQTLEDAIPRLREMLSQSGLNLMDANVSQHAPGRERQPDYPAAPYPTARSGDAHEGDAGGERAGTQRLRAGLIDAYV